MNQFGLHVVARCAIDDRSLAASGFLNSLGNELDLLVEEGERLEVVAVDLSAADQTKDGKQPAHFLASSPHFSHCLTIMANCLLFCYDMR